MAVFLHFPHTIFGAKGGDDSALALNAVSQIHKYGRPTL
jgi:hypothetical protein